MELSCITSSNREEINQFLIDHWFTTDIIVRGNIIDMTQVNGIVAYENGRIRGLVTYEIRKGECEIISLDSVKENCGIGTQLIDRIVDIAKVSNCSKVKLITTNDNINAIRFYQKRGFDMVKIFHNALDISRKLKPEIPLIGENGIPLRHEIEFEMILKC